jgi:hypothetical protein
VTLKQVEEGNSLEGIEELLVIPEIASGEAETGDDLAGLDGG